MANPRTQKISSFNALDFVQNNPFFPGKNFAKRPLDARYGLFNDPDIIGRVPCILDGLQRIAHMVIRERDGTSLSP